MKKDDSVREKKMKDDSIQCMYDKIIGHYEMLLEMVK